jgi:hypothetical protein
LPGWDCITSTKTEFQPERVETSNPLGSDSIVSALEKRSGGSSPAFDADVRTVPEIPALVVDADGSHVLRSKRNFGVSPDLDNAALAYDNLIETPAVFQLD